MSVDYDGSMEDPVYNGESEKTVQSDVGYIIVYEISKNI